MKNKPGYDEVLEALERALQDNPHLRYSPVEELAGQLVLSGYLTEEPSLGLMVEVMTTIVAGEQPFGPDGPFEAL